MSADNSRVGEGVEECDLHARVLRTVHQEFLDYGLVPQQSPRRLVQSAAGAFPPLRYGYGDAAAGGGGGSVVVIRALAMFDDLIVNATATSTHADGGVVDGEAAVEEVRRRIKLNVVTWSAAAGGAAGVGAREGGELLHWQTHQVTTFYLSAVCTSKLRRSNVAC